MKKLYAIFGGNFDPIHYGHIYSCENLLKNTSIKKIIFLPNNNPPHRQKTKTSIVDKIKMIKLAINKNSSFQISYLEAKKNQIFYTIDTLKNIRIQIGCLQSLCFIIGEDNLQNLHLWKNWKEILLYSHLLICPRIHIKNKNDQLEQWINSHLTKDFNLLYQKPYGLIFFLTTDIIHISSSDIRKKYFHGKSCHKLLPNLVNQYILSKKLYMHEQ